MTGNEKSGGGFSVNLTIGKEIDAALGDALRGLLRKPAGELGGLIADRIGILGDRVRLKRQLNAQLGMDEVRKKLEANNVDLELIASPKEEELHLLMNGLSLSDDENVRDMWAGLFANALDPNSNVTADRPFMRTLETLTPVDVKVIYFLSFVVKTERELKLSFKVFKPNSILNATVEEKEKMNAANLANQELRKQAVLSIENKAEQLGVKTISDPNWSENLLRQGVIEPLPIRNSSRLSISLSNERDIARAFSDIGNKIEELENATTRSLFRPSDLFEKVPFNDGIELKVQLSGFGTRLAEAGKLF